MFHTDSPVVAAPTPVSPAVAAPTPVVAAPTPQPVSALSSLPAAAPAASVPAAGPKWYTDLLLQAVTLLVTVGTLVAGLRLDKADFHAPFAYEYDALLILPFVKTTIDRGSHWRNERLGAPGIQELHDFPVVDHLHLAIIWLLSWIFPDPVVVFNVFHLLTYPLTAAAALFVFRRFGLSAPAAVAGAVLYAFQPYHYLRGQMHYFLAAYYVIPFTLMIVLWICRGRLPFFRLDDAGRYRRALWSGDAAWAVVIGIATASAGAYYAFFACVVLVAAGIYGWAAVRTWRVMASAWAVIGVIVAGGIANHGPSFVYQYEYGQNSRPHVRFAEDAERYGLRIAQLVLPVAQHNPVGINEFVAFDPAAVRAMYQAPQLKELNEADWDPLGLIGAVGYMILLLAVLIPARRAWPLGPLTALTVFLTLFGTTGGFGAVFNLLISSQVRCYNRVSIYIAFLALFASCWLVDRFFDGQTGILRRLRWPAFAALTLLGIWDQTNDQWFPDIRILKPGDFSVVTLRDQTAKKYWADQAFFEQIEQLQPDGMVFTYPFVEYPESAPYYETGATDKTESYEQALGYLHTRHLRWSFGAMKGREVDNWQREVCGLVGGQTPHAERFLERITLAGFEGLLVDSRGIHPHRFAVLKQRIEQTLGHGATRFFHPGRKLYFFDLRGYRDTLRQNYGTARFDAMAKAELEAFTVLWLKGFASYEPIGHEAKSHWCGRTGQLIFLNRSDEPIEFELRMTFRTTYKGKAALRIRGGVWSDDLEIGPGKKPPRPEYAKRIVVPPGRHAVSFLCTPAVSVMPNDSRDEVFTVLDFQMVK
ncbi:hypothetical protein [Fimbriiglobus ruber]|uniref:Integral membrane protein n=1 Tax=Fimbriiglobus ruber TaxID=1908690 RepID=A0A225D999_9BACT|nr:hypothetical protein [Fimbriiglobus ruber]OWK36234.1 Integral membrane protein [Fimbriiglobus ruber]